MLITHQLLVVTIVIFINRCHSVHGFMVAPDLHEYPSARNAITAVLSLLLLYGTFEHLAASQFITREYVLLALHTRRNM